MTAPTAKRVGCLVVPPDNRRGVCWNLSMVLVIFFFGSYGTTVHAWNRFQYYRFQRIHSSFHDDVPAPVLSPIQSKTRTRIHPFLPSSTTKLYGFQVHNNDDNDDEYQDKVVDNKDRDQTEMYHIKVSYERRSCMVPIYRGETILAALERNGIAEQLGIPALPFDCRRGNCLTCTARQIPPNPSSLSSSSTSSSASSTSSMVVQRQDDGLSPHMSEQIMQRGYLLTCCSVVMGDGLHVELGMNHQVWTDMYRIRLEDEQAQDVGRTAKARTIRLYNERHVDRWAKETQSILENM